MKVFVFDLLAYGEQLDLLKVDDLLPYPLPRRHFKADVAVRTYAEHLAAWEPVMRAPDLRLYKPPGRRRFPSRRPG